MTSDTRTPEDIERDIEREREEMRHNINSLQRKFSMDGIMNDVSEMVRDRSGDISRIARETVGRNPAAIALIGAGVAWLMLGKSDSNGQGSGSYGGSNGRQRTGSSHQSTGSRYAMGGRGMAGDDMAWLEDDLDGDGWNRNEGGGITDAVKRGASHAMDTAKDAAKDAVDAVRDSASRLTERLSHGTDGMSDTARERVVAARRAAYDAQRAARDAMHRGATAASDAYDSQPLVMGALAMAIGAGIGASLPRSRIENRTLGSSSDALVAEAQRAFRDEVHKARQAIEGAGDASGGEAMGDAGGQGDGESGTKGRGKRTTGAIVTPV